MALTDERALNVEEITDEQRQVILATETEQCRRIVAAARSRAVVPSARQFVFFAAFDGTNNDGNVEAMPTNVFTLYQQVSARRGDNLEAKYYPGPGTTGTLTASSWQSEAVTQQVTDTARTAFRDFRNRARAWLTDHPGRAVTASVTAFSRGSASAAIFSQLLFAEGLGAEGEVATPAEKVAVSAGVLFDPVLTGVKCEVFFAPNSGNLVQIRAQDEYRQLFRAADYRAPSRITCVDMLGNHCDIGGGYDNGIAALSLDAATKFLRKSGLPIADVGAARRFAGVGQLDVHKAQFDDDGNKIWDVYFDHIQALEIRVPSPRERTVVAAPAAGVAPAGAIRLARGARSAGRAGVPKPGRKSPRKRAKSVPPAQRPRAGKK